MIYDKNYYLMNANPSTFPREVLKSGELMNVLSVLLVYLRLKKIRDGAKTSHISSYTVVIVTLVRMRATLESSSKRGIFDRISSSQEFWNFENWK